MKNLLKNTRLHKYGDGVFSSGDGVFLSGDGLFSRDPRPQTQKPRPQTQEPRPHLTKYVGNIRIITIYYMAQQERIQEEEEG